MRRDIESRVRHLYPFRGNSCTTYTCHLFRITLLNRNILTRWEFQVNARARRNHIARNTVSMGQDGNAIGAELVREIAIGGYSVGSDKHGFDCAMTHEVACHISSKQG